MATRKIQGITIKLGLDGKEVTQNLNILEKDFKKSQTELNKINKALKLDPTNTELLAQKQEVLTKAIEKSRLKLQELESLRDKAAKAASNQPAYMQEYVVLAQKIDAANKKMKELEAQKKKLDEKGDNVSTEEWEKYEQQLKEVKEEQDRLQESKKDLDARFSEGHLAADEYRQYKREIEQVRAETERLEKESKQLENVTDESSKAFRKAVESTKEYQQAMDKLKASSSELKGKLNDIWNFALKVGGAITSAALVAGAAATKVGTDFDASMSVVQAYSKAAGSELEALRDAAKEMGATTSKTASEAAEGLSYMALAGWDTQKMLTGLEPMLRASEAANADLGTTSDLVTDSMSAMGVSVEELTHYLDICAEAQSDSNTSMTEMLQAYVGAGGMFKNLNTELDESATLIGVLANKGIKGSEAGSALNSILINLIGANKNAANAMDALGVSAYDAKGKFIGITETLRLVSKSLETVSEEDRNLFTSKIGGKTQYDTLMALLNGVNDDYDELFENIQNSNGALERTAKIMRDNLKGDAEMLTSALQDLGIEVNDTFTESFREAVQTATKEVSKLSDKVSDGELNESLRKIAEAFAKLMEQIVEFSLNKGVPAVVNLFEFIADNGAVVKGLIVGIASSFAAFKIIGTANGLWKSLIKTIDDYKKAAEEANSTTKALTTALGINPWVVLAAAVAVVAAGLITFALNADTANNRIREYRKEIQELDNQVNKLTETTQKSINRSEAEITVIEDKARQYEGLRVIQNRTADQEERLKDLANDLQQYMPDNVKLIDEQTGAYNSLAGAIDGVILSMKKNAYVQAYENQITEIVTAQIEAKENLENLQREFNSLDEWLKGKGAIEVNGTIGFDNPLSALANMDEMIAWENAKAGIDKAKQSIENYDKEIQNLEKDISDVYSDFNKNQIVDASADGARIAAEGMAKKYQEEGKKAVETAAKEAADVLSAFQDEMDTLDNKKNIHGFADDSEYWNERRRVLNTYLLKESEEWWAYYDETEEYFNDLTETQREAWEKQIDNQAEALKERKELEDDFTDDMYYDELEKLISCLDKESDQYKKYNSEILKGRKELAKDLATETAESTKEQIDIVSAAISETQAEYKKALDDAVSEREAYKNKLMGMTNLYTSDIKTDENGNKSGTFTLENIDEQIKAVEEYDNKLKQLEDKGAGEGLLNYIEGLSQEDADNFMHVLESMTDEELKNYSDKYDKLIDTVNKRAEDRYNPQIEEINQNFTKKLLEQMGTLPDDMATLGQEAVNSFIKGFNGKPEELIEAVTEKCNAVIEGFKNGLDIHSPSKETEKIGEYAGAGFEKGLEQISGADAAEKFADDFILKMAEKDKELHDVLFGAFAENTADAIAQMNANASNAMKNIIPSLQLPDITKLQLPKSSELSLTAQKADERVISRLDGIEELSEKMDALIMLLSTLISQSKTNQIDLTNTINTYLNGKLIAKEVIKQQKTIQKGEGT